MRMSPGIDVDDFNTKLRNAQKFLAEGNRVKVTVRFRGREMAHTDIGKQLLLKISPSSAPSIASMDKDPKLEGRHMSMFLAAQESLRMPRSKYHREALDQYHTCKRMKNLLCPSCKTHSGAKKRFKLTKNGKVKRAHAFKPATSQ